MSKSPRRIRRESIYTRLERMHTFAQCLYSFAQRVDGRQQTLDRIYCPIARRRRGSRCCNILLQHRRPWILVTTHRLQSWCRGRRVRNHLSIVNATCVERRVVRAKLRTAIHGVRILTILTQRPRLPPGVFVLQSCRQHVTLQAKVPSRCKLTHRHGAS